MSRHSKWSKIKHKKGAADKARSSSFTKLLRSVMVAAQGGGDPEMNFALRLAIDKAKEGNVPKENIERAIKRGVGDDKEGASFVEALYEGFGPGGVALLIACLTDNTNRTVSDVKNVLSKNGGSPAGQGSVQWQFSRRGVIRLSGDALGVVASQHDAFELALMDAGAEDIIEDESFMEVLCPAEQFATVLHAVTSFGVSPDDSGLEWVAKEHIEIEDETAEKLALLIDALEENDDVVCVYTNA